MNPARALSAWDLALSATLLVVAAGLSLALSLGLARRLSVAALRTVLQLLAIGLVLKWVFARAEPLWVVILMVSMVANAALAGVQRAEERYPGVFVHALLAIGVSSLATTFTVTEAILGVTPWYTPQYLIPLLGMVLGNTLTGISLCLEQTVGGLRKERTSIEGTLALGATIWEATRPVIRAGVRAGLVPILNAMSVVGLVSLPGMMTGQILAGADPLTAVGYQIVVMFMVAGGTAIGTVTIALLAFRRLTTKDHQLRDHPLHRAR